MLPLARFGVGKPHPKAKDLAMILDLHFADEVEPFPCGSIGSRIRGPLKGYTPVKVPELALGDVEEAIVIKRATRNSYATDAWTWPTACR